MKKTPQPANEWIVNLDDSVPCDRVVELPAGFEIDPENPDFATSPTAYADRVLGARLHVRAVDGPVRPRKFRTYALALAAAREEFAGGEASFDGIRVFDGITVKGGIGRRWWPVQATL